MMTKLEAAAAEYAKAQAEADDLHRTAEALAQQSESLFRESQATRARAFDANDLATAALVKLRELAKEYAR